MNDQPDNPLPRRGRGVSWRQDPLILARLAEVERRHLTGAYNTQIARELGVDEGTIRTDLKRLAELWHERAGAEVEELRWKKLRELELIAQRALAAAAFDESAERAVLYGKDADGNAAPVVRDDKGGASFRGNKAAALNVARAAIMDQVKLLGLVTEKLSLDVTVRQEAERLAAEFGLDVADVLAEADAIVKGRRR